MMVATLRFTLLALLNTALGFRTVTPPKSSNVYKHQPCNYNDSKLYASGGAPQYDKINAVLESVEEVADGSFLLHVNTGTSLVDYQPGHVLAFEMQAKDLSSLTGKAAEDAKKNEGWMRGPYTVSRATDNSFDILIKVVGEKSREFATATGGTQVRFGGKFKVPILEGIQKNSTKSVILLSTGVGVGPCVGAIEEAMKDESFPPINLVANYRTASDVIYEKYLTNIANTKSNRFRYTPFVTSEQGGRISDSEKNMDLITKNYSTDLGLSDIHYHLIGNGQMVKEWKEGLSKAGVPDDKITVEMYFNHQESAREEAVERISNIINACSNNYASII